MKTKIHALQVEIKTIESLMDSLNGQMQQLAMDEVKNLRFELDLLKRNNAIKEAMPQIAAHARAKEESVFA